MQKMCKKYSSNFISRVDLRGFHLYGIQNWWDTTTLLYFKDKNIEDFAASQSIKKKNLVNSTLIHLKKFSKKEKKMSK